jgi:hypothetical protein
MYIYLYIYIRSIFLRSVVAPLLRSVVAPWYSTQIFTFECRTSDFIQDLTGLERN